MFLLLPLVFIAVTTNTTQAKHDNRITVSPPIIMQKELVLRQEVVLPPPTPVIF